MRLCEPIVENVIRGSLMSAAPPVTATVPVRGAPFRVMPGFRLSLGFTIFYLALIVLIPLSAVFLKTFTMSWPAFWAAVSSERVVASYKLTFGASLIAAFLNVIFGGIVAWVLVRYEFPGKRIIDALVDLPFALPTAVAGITLTALYSSNGWFGSFLEGVLGIKVAFTPLGIVIALTFIGLPFVVRTVQPVLEDAERELEEAAASLGANAWQTFSRVVLPTITPSLMTGFALAFARARRIRLGHLHRRQYADGVGNHAAVHHHQTGTVRLRRRHRHRRGHAAGLLHHAVVHQSAASLGARQDG